MSRNRREGRFVGCVRGKAVRRRARVPAILLSEVELLPACAPYVDACIAWLTLAGRKR